MWQLFKSEGAGLSAYKIGAWHYLPESIPLRKAFDFDLCVCVCAPVQWPVSHSPLPPSLRKKFIFPRLSIFCNWNKLKNSNGMWRQKVFPHTVFSRQTWRCATTYVSLLARKLFSYFCLVRSASFRMINMIVGKLEVFCQGMFWRGGGGGKFLNKAFICGDSEENIAPGGCCWYIQSLSVRYRSIHSPFRKTCLRFSSTS